MIWAAVQPTERDLQRMQAHRTAVGLSVSGFHHHCNVVTALSPLPFQKRLHRQAAR